VQCHVTKPVDSFPVPVSTSIRNDAFKCCTACLDKRKAADLAAGKTSYMEERDRIRSLHRQFVIKATLVGSEGYGQYEEACKAANPKKVMLFQSLDFKSSTTRDGRDDQ